jgi:hypothetical protein
LRAVNRILLFDTSATSWRAYSSFPRFLSALNISSLALTYRKDRRTFVPRQVTKIHELMRAFATREVAHQRQRQAAVRASRWGAAIKCQPIAILSHSCDGFSFAIGSTWDIFPHKLTWENLPRPYSWSVHRSKHMPAVRNTWVHSAGQPNRLQFCLGEKKWRRICTS